MAERLFLLGHWRVCYPDAYFDGQTWDFKKSNSEKGDTIRQIIKNGRKADNLIFIIDKREKSAIVSNAIKSEYGMRKKDGSWKELPDIYVMLNEQIDGVWTKTPTCDAHTIEK